MYYSLGVGVIIVCGFNIGLLYYLIIIVGMFSLVYLLGYICIILFIIFGMDVVGLFIIVYVLYYGIVVYYGYYLLFIIYGI